MERFVITSYSIHYTKLYEDSLSYKLTTCRSDNGEPIVGYTYPQASNSLTVNARTGDLVWDTPVYPGIYNVAIVITSYSIHYTKLYDLASLMVFIMLTTFM